MNTYGPFFGKYGVTMDVSFCLQDQADANILYNSYVFATGDINSSIDGAAPTALDADACDDTGDPVYKLTLSAAEMQGEVITVFIEDQGTEAFIPAVITIYTELMLGKLGVDATQYGSNNAAVTLQGVGTETALKATGGATGAGVDINGGSSSGAGIDVDATSGDAISAVSASGDGLQIQATGGNGNGLNAIGVGTGYGICNSGASAAYYNNVLLQLEGSEPSATTADNATLLAIVQAIKRRFVNKVVVSGTTLTWYKDDASTALQTQTIADDGSTATVGATS